MRLSILELDEERLAVRVELIDASDHADAAGPVLDLLSDCEQIREFFYIVMADIVMAYIVMT